MIKPSKNAKIFTGEIADYWYSPEGILYSYSKNPKRTIKNISENIQLVKSITNNKIVPLFIYLCNSPVPDRATRKFAAQQLPNVYSAMAMISTNVLSKFIMNILFNVKPPSIPMKSFSDEQMAIKWLEQYL